MLQIFPRISAALLLAAIGAAPAEPAEETPLTIWIAGGLLGRLDPFWEKVADPATGKCRKDRVYLGGLLPLQRSLAAHPLEAYVLLTGNNFPKNITVQDQDRFWNSLDSLRGDVVALGQDDFLRAILPVFPENSTVRHGQKEQRGFTKEWADFLRRAAAKRHFLASNAALRRHAKGMNQIRHKEYFLSISADESVAWTTAQLSIDVPPGERPTLKVKGAGAEQDCKPSKEDEPENPRSDIFTCPVQLRAETTYDVMKDSERLFTFTTDAALTPWSNSGGLDQVPAALLKGRGAPLLAVAIVDPGVRSVVGVDLWKFKDPGKRGEETELVFLPPKDTAKAILAAAAKSGAASAVPVLLGDLSDTESLKLIASDPRWRVASFNPDTQALGRTAAEDDCRTSGGYAMIDERSQVWVRPEWVGETVIELNGSITAGTADFASLQVRKVAVEGQDLATTAEAADRTLTYTFVSAKAGTALSPVKYELYEPGSRCPNAWWCTQEGIAHKLMEAMRSELHTEIALADKSMIDRDIAAAMKDARSRLTFKELSEILWRHDVYVVVPRLGSELVSMLQAIAALPVPEDGGYCELGVERHNLGSNEDASLACAIPKVLNAMQVRVNGRFLDPKQQYSVAMPQGLAEALKVNVPLKNLAADVMVRFDRYLRNEARRGRRRPPTAAGARSAPEASSGGADSAAAAELPQTADPPEEKPPQVRAPNNPYVKRWLGMVYAPPIAFEVSDQVFHVPVTGDPSRFSAIPVAGEQVQHQQKWSIDGELHVIPLDFSWLTLDLLSKAKVARTDTFDDLHPLVLTRTLSPDRWTNGGVITVRKLTNRITGRLERRTKALLGAPLRIEPYLGVFGETSVFHVHNTFRTTRNDADVYITEDDKKPDYRFLEGGVRFGDIKKTLKANSLSLKGLSWGYDWGTNHRAISGYVIGSQQFAIQDLRFCSMQTVLDGKCTPQGGDEPLSVDPLPVNPTIDPTYFGRRENRYQLTGSLEFLRGTDESSQQRITLEFLGRLWQRDQDLYLEPLWSTEFNLKTALPLGHSGISWGPYVRWLRVKAKGDPGIYYTVRAGVTFNFSLTGKLGAGRVLY